MEKLLFGTAGIPHSSEGSSSISGIERIRELGLDCMELEFVRGVHMGGDTARAVRTESVERSVTLSVHAPYYINLNSKDEEKIGSSIKRIKDTARIGAICGARNIIFHPAYYHTDMKEAVYSKVKSLLEKLYKDLTEEGVSVTLRPETTGKASQFGSLKELLRLSVDVEGVLPCIDFAHLHSRNQNNNSKDEFISILIAIEDMLGRTALDDMHIHISGIEYTEKGERRHLNLGDSDLRFEELLEVWREFNIGGLVVCESPNLEGDALRLQNRYL